MDKPYRDRLIGLVQLFIRPFIALLVGVVITNLFKGALSNNDIQTLLIAIIGFFALISIPVVANIATSQSGKAIAQVEDVSVRALREIVDKVATIEYVTYGEQGEEFYRKLGGWIEAAEKSIVAISPASIEKMAQDKGGDENLHRKSYYPKIGKRVREMDKPEKVFQYLRIFQQYEDKPIVESHKRIVEEHCADIKAAKQEHTDRNDANNNWDISIKKITRDRDFGYVVIDDKRIVVIIDAVDANNIPIHTGALFIEEKKLARQLVEDVRRLRDTAVKVV